MLKTPDVVIVVPCLLNSNCSVYPGGLSRPSWLWPFGGLCHGQQPDWYATSLFSRIELRNSECEA